MNGEILDADAIREIRRERTVTGVAEANRLLGTPDDTPDVPLRRLDPRQTMEAGKELVLGSFLNDPVKFGLLADMLRGRDPKLAKFSNEQLRRIAVAMYDVAIREATDEAFRNLGRGDELKIKTEGF